MRPAASADIETLVDLMGEFYAESGYVLDREHAAQAFAALLAEPRLGRVWLVEAHAPDAGVAAAGYVVLTFAFGMEYGGLMAAIDDLYIRPAYRNRGLGGAALIEVRERCAKLGVRAIGVEVDAGNDAARAVYRRTGFVATDRLLMTLRLADPTYVE